MRADLETGYTAQPESVTVEVSVVIPCLNEAVTLGQCIDVAQQALREAGVAGEVVVADNGSTDDSREDRDRARRPRGEGRGQGLRQRAPGRHRGGARRVRADGGRRRELRLRRSPVFLAAAPRRLTTSSSATGSAAESSVALCRSSTSGSATPCCRASAARFFRTPCGDIYCGLRAFRRDAIERFGSTPAGMEFAIEMVVKASLYDLSVSEVPTTLVAGQARPQAAPAHLARRAGAACASCSSTARGGSSSTRASACRRSGSR